MAGDDHIVDGVIVVVAKAPLAGLCKSRLAKDIGKARAARAASISLGIVTKNAVGAVGVPNVLVQVAIGKGRDVDDEESWEAIQSSIYCPLSTMVAPRDSDLGTVLTEGLREVQSRFKGKPVVFVGADCPLASSSILREAVIVASTGKAMLMPARDGGYQVLSVPSSVNPDQVFRDVTWSSPTTFESQRHILESVNKLTVLQPETDQTYPDLDELEDLVYIASRYPEFSECI